MKLNISLFICCLLIITSCQKASDKSTTQSTKTTKSQPIAIVIHGGAGNVTPERIPPEKQKEYENKLDEAISKGYAILQNGGASMDAVIATINILENSPLFNAGKGAVFNYDGYNELDASIMDGKTQNAGAIAGVTKIKNPINLAYEVMVNSDHVMLSGKGAEEFAKTRNFEFVDSTYFMTERRLKALQRAKGNETAHKIYWEDSKYGTVGCVAIDKEGNIVAGTSTGGMTNKRWNRIGDAPIIGAGTYANNETCGVSATGWGEYFIRLGVAHDISAQMMYANKSLQEASEEVIMNKLENLGGDGGIVALDKQANISMVFNSNGMFRASIDKDGKKVVKIFRDQEILK
jgi:beta-aspartyl-peptidase (threonine type)